MKKTGGWVMVRQTIPVEIPVDPMAIYYAVPVKNKFFFGDENRVGSFTDYAIRHASSYTGLSDDMFKELALRVLKKRKSKSFKADSLSRTELQVLHTCEEHDITLEAVTWVVSIKTPFGDVVLNPHEYTEVKMITQYIDFVKDGDYYMRFISKTAQLEGKLKDQIFYLRTRGIPYVEALKMCIGNIRTQNLFYLEPSPPAANHFTRNYLPYIEKKNSFIKNTDQKHLLEYKDFVLSEYIQHLKSLELSTTL